ncbi:MAG: biotin/lipoyl-containing protein, partial [Rubricoccaceae bacterium]
MAIAVEMPKMSDTMEEGVLVAWLANEGDAVSAGDVIAQVETDKATMDLEVYDDGVLLRRVVGEGDSVPIGGLIAVLGKEGESADDVLASYGAPSGDGASRPADAPPSEARASDVELDPPEVEAAAAVPAGYGGGSGAAEVAEAAPAKAGAGDGAASGDGRVKASPLARRMAREAGLDLARLSGSGPE